MASRKTQHGKVVQKEKVADGRVHGEERMLRQKLTIGKPYSPEKLHNLIAALNSKNRLTQITAVAQFAENQAAVTEAASSDPDVTATEITDKVIEIVLKNETVMLKKFETERNYKALKFLAESSAVPKQIRKDAEETIKRLPQLEPEAVPVKKPEEPAAVTAKEMYSAKKVKALLKALNSKVPEMRVNAAIQFIKDYAKITPTVAKIPMLTVTQVTTKAVDVIKKKSDTIIGMMVELKMFKSLEFLSSLAQVPLDIQKKAAEALSKAKTVKKRPPSVKVVESSEKPAISKEDFPRSKEYSPLQLEALLNGLESVHRLRASKAAIEFLKNYEAITQAVAKAPMLTVTDVTKKAVKAVEQNILTVLKTLRDQKEAAALNLLANSSEFSTATRKKAAAVLKMLMGPVNEEE